MSKSKAYHKQIGRYVQGKDNNQPDLMETVFSQDAVLKMLVNSEAIDFPSEVIGLEGITQTLCTQFNERFEKVRTLCFLDTVLRSNNLINCRWLVGMISKETGALHCGYGEYHWTFEKDYSPLSLHQVKKLTIVIEDMVTLALDSSDSSQVETQLAQHNAMLAWLSSCTYPWAISHDALANMPEIEALKGIKKGVLEPVLNT